MESQNNNQEAPFAKMEEAQVITISRVDSIVQIAEKSFEEVFIECGGEKKQKELASKLKKVLALPKDEPQTLKDAKAVKKELATIRIALENSRKAMKRDIIDAGKGIDSGCEKFQNKFSPDEEKAQKFIDEIEELKKAAEEKEAKEKEERKQIRIKELESNGCPFTGQWWSINDISLGVQQIEESTEEQWSDMIAKVKVQNEKNIQEAEAKKQKEEADRLEQERIAKEQKEKQDELDRKEKELNEKMAKIEAAEKLENERKEREEREKKEAEERLEREAKEREQKELLATNAKSYEALGYSYNFKDEYWALKVGENVSVISKDEMLKSTNEFLADKEEQIKNWQIEKLKSERNAELKPYIVFIRDYNKMLSLDEADYKKELDDIKEAARLQYEYDQEQQRIAKQNDTERYNGWIDRLLAIIPPSVSDERLIELGNNIIKLLVKQ